MSRQTLFDKIWSAHKAASFPGGRDALLIDRCLLHEITGAYALRDLINQQKQPRLAPSQIFAVADHSISTAPDRQEHDSPNRGGSELITLLDQSCQKLGLHYARPNGPDHGIVHVAGPEQGFVLPGTTLVCGDSHTCTNGALGALAFGAGSSEIETALEHGALVIQRPKTLRIHLSGSLAPQVFSKDVALALLGRYGARLALGYAIEFDGELVARLPMEARLTLCNMAAEMGTRYAMVGVDEVTLAYLREHNALSPELLEQAMTTWRTLHSDPDACFDHTLSLDTSNLAPQVTWGTSPMHAVGIDECVPDLARYTDLDDRQAAQKALDYMGLQPGQPLNELAIDAAFIGSCTNARISDLRAAAAVLEGRKVAPGVRAMCTPGSQRVRAQAEAEGLDRIFIEAGFSWRQPGCSNCGGREGPIWQGLRVVSATNRNFENRQGQGTRTHLASPATVAASAVRGRLTDPRQLG